MTQAAIALGELGIRRDDPDFYAVEVLNDVLSGSFTSRLVSEIRTAKGLAYAVAGGVGADFDHPGMTELWMTTKTETAGAGLGALLDEARDLDPPPAHRRGGGAGRRRRSSTPSSSTSTRPTRSSPSSSTTSTSATRSTAWSATGRGWRR